MKNIMEEIEVNDPRAQSATQQEAEKVEQITIRRTTKLRVHGIIER